MPLRIITELGKRLLSRGWERFIAVKSFGQQDVAPIRGEILSNQPDLDLGDAEEIAALIRDGLDAAIEIERSDPATPIDLDLIPVNQYMNDVVDNERFMYATNVEVADPQTGASANVAVNIPSAVELSRDELDFLASTDAVNRITLSPEKFGFPKDFQPTPDTIVQVTFVERDS